MTKIQGLMKYNADQIQAIEQKIYKRRRCRKIRKKKIPSAPKGMFEVLSVKIQTRLITFLKRERFVLKSYIQKKIIVPKFFSFENNNDDSIVFFKRLLSTYMLSDEVITIDFSLCEKIDISNAMFLEILLKEFSKTENRYNNCYYKKVNKVINCTKSNSLKVNKCLFILKIIREVPDINENDRYLDLGLKTGLKTRKSYKESHKGAICLKIRHFVNESLKASSVELNPNGITKLDNLISEILNNAEDHSIHNEWYVNGVSYIETNENDPIIELNLAILNLGFSIYKGFKRTQQKNIDIMNKMKKIYNKHLRQMNIFSPTFAEDDLYTLYALQEGISRLKFIDQSRGNGTMNFINAFIDLGAFGEDNPSYKSHLNIISGNTTLLCDNTRKPYIKDDNRYLSLNKENDIAILPEKEFLKHNNEYFPGTFLEVKIYLNDAFFKKLLPE